MITAEIDTNGDHTVTATYRAPSVYLDTCAIRRVAEDSTLRRRFADALIRKDGTFLISYASIVEIGRMKGDSLRQIKEFFAQIGTTWFPLDCDAVRVIEREGSSSKQPPCLDIKLIEGYYPHIYGETLTLAKVVDLVRGDKQRYEEIHQSADQLVSHINSLKAAYKSGAPGISQDIYREDDFDPLSPTTYTYHGLMRYVFESDMKIERNDVYDIWHAAVPLAYANFIVIDKTWRSIAETRLKKLPRSEKWVGDSRLVEQFIDVLERVVVNGGWHG